MKRLIIVFFAAFLFAMPKPAYADVENGMLSDETEVIVDTDASEDNSSDNDSSDASNDTASDHDSSDASEGDITHVSQSLVDNTDQNQSAVVVPDDAVDALDGGDLIDSGDPADPTDPSVGTTTEDEGPDDSSGWLTIDGYTFYVDPDTGKPLSGGIFEIDGESYYLRPAGSPYGPEGSLGSGWVTNYGGNTYFFDRESGQMYSDGIFDIDGARYYFRPEESPYGPAGSMGRGWVIGYGDEGLDYFFDRVSATMVIGRNDVDGSSYFFDPVTGAKQTGWFEFDGYRYRYDEDGKMLYDGIYEVEDESYYFRPSGSSYGPKGSVGYGWVWNYGGDTFFFDRNDGHMLSDGIFEVDGSSYFFRPSDSPYGPEGSMGKGWVYGYGEDGVDRFFDRSTGRMYVDCVRSISGYGAGVYGFDNEGSLISGWFDFDGFTYYFDSTKGNAASIGIVEIDEVSYFFRFAGSSYGPEGSRGSGWVWNYGGDTFFFDRDDGHMLSGGIFEVDGSSYYFRPSDSPYGPEGSMGRGWVHGYGEDGVDRFFDRSTGRMLISGTYIIDRAVYRADIEGNLTLSPFGQHLDAASAKQLKVVSAAWNEPTTPLGWCALWVHNVFESYGIVDVYGNANDLYNEYCTSSNPADLQVGMIVAVSRHPGNSGGRVYGHIGIYVGDGIVLDSSGSVRVWNVEDWINSYNGWVTPKWGWYGGRSLR